MNIPIAGLKEVKYVLKLLIPFLQLKKKLTSSEVLVLMDEQSNSAPNEVANQLIRLGRLVDATAAYNYNEVTTLPVLKHWNFLRTISITSP